MKLELSWNKVKEMVEKKFDYKIEVVDLSTPELVAEYIKKYRLSSSIAEIKLLSTPELVAEYIKKYELSSSSAKMIFSINNYNENTDVKNDE